MTLLSTGRGHISPSRIQAIGAPHNRGNTGSFMVHPHRTQLRNTRRFKTSPQAANRHHRYARLMLHLLGPQEKLPRRPRPIQVLVIKEHPYPRTGYPKLAGQSATSLHRPISRSTPGLLPHRQLASQRSYRDGQTGQPASLPGTPTMTCD